MTGNCSPVAMCRGAASVRCTTPGCVVDACCCALAHRAQDSPVCATHNVRYHQTTAACLLMVFTAFLGLGSSAAPRRECQMKCIQYLHRRYTPTEKSCLQCQNNWRGQDAMTGWCAP